MSEEPQQPSFFRSPEQSDSAQDTVAPEKRRFLSSELTIWSVMGISIIYIMIAVMIGLSIEFTGFTMITISALFFYGIILGIGVQNILRKYNQTEQDRAILLEVLEGSRGARLITDPNDIARYSNARFNALVESIGPASYETMLKLFSVNPKSETLLKDLANMAHDGGIESVELPARIKNEERWLQVVAQPIAGWPGFVHWRLDDITRRYRAQLAVKEEQEKLKDFTDNAPMGFFSVDGQGIFRFINSTLAERLGATPNDIIGKHKLHDFLEPPILSLTPYDILPNGDAHQKAEINMQTITGKPFQVEIIHSVMKEPDGSVITRSVVQDLTVEQRMREALKESEDRFRRLFEEAPLGVALIEKDGQLSECNLIFADMIGIKERDVNQYNLSKFISVEGRKAVLNWIKHVANGQDSVENLIEAVLADRPVQLYARRFKGSANLVLHVIDMTEQRNLELQFTQSQKMQAVGQLAGGVAHDFNNLLTAMTGFCDLLLLRHKPGDPSFNDIMQIKQNSNRAANLVRQLLAFSRQQTLQPQILDMTDVLTELSHLLRRLIGANIDLDITHGSDLGLIKVDQGQLEQVLINLAVNARDAMPEGGKLSITSEHFTNKKSRQLGSEKMPPGDWVAVSVSDSGTGIDPDHLAKIFDPFFTTKEVGAGTGLGLSTVYGIIRQTGGYIDVESTIGKGTTFTIYLPRHDASELDVAAPAARTQDKDDSQDLTGSATILLVEDEDAVRTFSARALANKGYHVIEAAGGDEALRKFEDSGGELDLLVTDVVMPQMDGPTLAKHIREKRPDLKIIFISGYTEDKFKEHMGDNITFLPKPFSLKQLALKVKEVLEG